MYLVDNKQVLLCVGGGIAAYKAAELTRRFMDAGASVNVAMTRASQAFIQPLTLQALSRRPVATELLSVTQEAEIGHIKLAEDADVVLVAPATANLIARMAMGMADDVVTATLLATKAPVVVAPAMNGRMLEHPAVVENISRLEDFGYRVVRPDSGELACGYHGPGRLPDPEVLIEEVGAALTDQDMRGLRVLVSAGPTREPFDPVRYISNRSSGRMGYAVARAARRRGADVTLVSGPVTLSAPHGCSVVQVETAAQMKDAMVGRVTDSDVVVMVAAVADYRPSETSDTKLKKSDSGISIELQRTEDILQRLSAARGDRVVVGFAAETTDVKGYAAKKLADKNLDLIVANDVSAEGAGFDTETNSAVLISRDGREESTGVISKDELADRLLDGALALRSPAQALNRRA